MRGCKELAAPSSSPTSTPQWPPRSHEREEDEAVRGAESWMQSSTWGQARQAKWLKLCLEGEVESTAEGQGERVKVRWCLGD